MKFATPLIEGRLIQRYKRFLADVRLADGSLVTVACPNTGTMLGLTAAGSRVYLSRSDSATRKYPHTWELIEVDGPAGVTLVGINTGHPNGLVAEAIAASRIPLLAGYEGLRREVKYGRNSRIDILLEDASRPPCYVEVKNVHLGRVAGLAEFPDCRTERGVKHLAEMSDMVRAGARAVMVYLVQRQDCDRFAIARDIDPTYGEALDMAVAAGVETLAIACRLSAAEIVAERLLPLVLSPVAGSAAPPVAGKRRRQQTG